MDNKKLMHILLRDVQELEQLVVEIGQVGHFDKLDMELLYTRIKGVRHLLEVATELKTPPSSNREVPSSNPEPSVHVPEKAASSPAPAEPEQAPRPAVPQEKAVVSSPVEPETGKGEQPATAPETRQESSPQEEIHFRHKEEPHPEKQILGEKFTAGKSVHDLLMGEKNQNDLRFSIPIPSLSSAIGTNGRFLFTRELFDGNMDHFSETIHKLDEMKTIREAVDFLQENFQWKNNETSRKFMELVKRRFL